MNKKILVVDDNVMQVRFISGVLEKDGHEVRTAQNGFLALNMLTSFTPDIIFADLIMPKIGGDVLFNIVRKMPHLSNCFLVVLSAAVVEMKSQEIEMHADHFIAKGPFKQMAEYLKTAVALSDQKRSEDNASKISGGEEFTDRQVTTELILRSRHLERVIQSLDDGVLEIYMGKVINANTAAVEKLNRPIEKIIGTSFLSLLDPEHARRLKIVAEASDKEIVEVGLNHPIELNSRLLVIKRLPVKGDGDTQIVMIKDVSDQKLLEMQLRHAQKMEALGTISSGIAHNFRNSLAGILVNSQMLQSEYSEDEKLCKHLERINVSVKRGAELVNRLLQFSRKQNLAQFSKIRLEDVIEEIKPIIERSMEGKIHTEFHIQNQDVYVNGDFQGLCQVVVNLCNNADDAMSEGGNLIISVSQKGSTGVITVSDTGHGMTKEVLRNCFDPFFTTKDISKGTGLGLSTSYGIVKSHKGDIHATSTVNKGSTFEVRIPLLSAAAAEGDDAAAVDAAERQTRVLIINHAANTSESLLGMVEKLGYQARVAATADEAIDLYWQWKPEKVLVEWCMSDTECINCARQIRQHDPNARIAVISGCDADMPVFFKYEDKAVINGWLPRPFDIDELKSLLKSIRNIGPG